AGGWLAIEPEQRNQKLRAVGHPRRLLVDQLNLVAFQHRDIHKLLGFVAATVLDNQQTGCDHLQYQTRRRQVSRGAPDEEFVSLAPDAEVNAGALDGRRQACEWLRS